MKDRFRKIKWRRGVALNGRRQTSWLFTSMVELLSSEQIKANPEICDSLFRIWNFRIYWLIASLKPINKKSNTNFKFL